MLCILLKVGSCGIVSLSNIDKQNFNLTILFSFFNIGFITFMCFLITPFFFSLTSKVVLIFNPAAKSR